MSPGLDGITFHIEDASGMSELRQAWGASASGHLHFQAGITISARSRTTHVGLITAYTRTLPAPLQAALETFIDFLEVREEFQDRGIAGRLVEMALAHAKSLGHYQVRGWTSQDNIEAIHAWVKLRFGLHPGSTSAQGKEVRGYFATKTL
jgi:GNAT superfamily N-acetyltransferase